MLHQRSVLGASRTCQRDALYCISVTPTPIFYELKEPLLIFCLCISCLRASVYLHLCCFVIILVFVCSIPSPSLYFIHECLFTLYCFVFVFGHRHLSIIIISLMTMFLILCCHVHVIFCPSSVVLLTAHVSSYRST